MKTLGPTGRVAEAKTFTTTEPEAATPAAAPPSAGLPGSKARDRATGPTLQNMALMASNVPGDHVLDPTGAWKRMHMRDPMPYDKAYVAKYDKPPYSGTSQQLAFLRM